MNIAKKCHRIFEKRNDSQKKNQEITPQSYSAEPLGHESLNDC